MVDITWLGQMGFILKTKTTSICIDYFATPMEERLVPPPILRAKPGRRSLCRGTGICLHSTAPTPMNLRNISVSNTAIACSAG